MVRVMDTDVLVIGSGIAGCTTAIESNKRGLTVIIIDKTLLGRGGSSRLGRRFLIPNKVYEELFNVPPPKFDLFNFWITTMYFYDLELSKKILNAMGGEENYQQILELEELGVFWRRTADGTVWPEPGVGIHSPKADAAGKVVLDILVPEIRRRNITILEEHMATKLLTHNGEVVGATALDIITSELVVIRAKATVLATGTTSTYPISSPPDTLTGDGYVMALRAGAELIDICQLVYYDYGPGHLPDKTWPKGWRFSLGAFTLRPFAPKLKYGGAGEFIDEKGVPIFEKYDEWFGPFRKLGMDLHQQTGLLAQCSAKEMAEGRGPIRVSYQHIPNVKERMKEIWYKYPFFEKVGIDPQKDTIPLGAIPHTTTGGIRMTAKAEAYGVPGLYVVGGVSALGTGMNLCYASGKWASEAVADRIKDITVPPLDWDQVEVEEEKVTRILEKKVAGGVTPAAVKKMIKEVMWGKCGFWKNEKDMTACLNELQRIKTEVLPKVSLQSSTKGYNKGLVEYFEVENMLDYCMTFVEMALLTKGSYMQFRRTDYPGPGDVPVTEITVKIVDGKRQYKVIEAPPQIKKMLETTGMWSPEAPVH